MSRTQQLFFTLLLFTCFYFESFSAGYGGWRVGITEIFLPWVVFLFLPQEAYVPEVDCLPRPRCTHPSSLEPSSWSSDIKMLLDALRQQTGPIARPAHMWQNGWRSASWDIVCALPWRGAESSLILRSRYRQVDARSALHRWSHLAHYWKMIHWYAVRTTSASLWVTCGQSPQKGRNGKQIWRSCLLYPSITLCFPNVNAAYSGFTLSLSFQSIQAASMTDEALFVSNIPQFIRHPASLTYQELKSVQAIILQVLLSVI